MDYARNVQFMNRFLKMESSASNLVTSTKYSKINSKVQSVLIVVFMNNHHQIKESVKRRNNAEKTKFFIKYYSVKVLVRIVLHIQHHRRTGQYAMEINVNLMKN